MASPTLKTVNHVDIAGSNIFYRQDGPKDPSAPTILLLHGFPSSSFQFRNLMPLLAKKGYRVIAPDLPGFGFTTVPDGYSHSFANLATTIEGFVDALNLERFAIYIFDYGAPTGLRFALKHPEKVAAIVSQNGNAYDEGLGEQFWQILRTYWDSGAEKDREALRNAYLGFEATKWQYTNGANKPDSVEPEAYHLDQALMERPGNKDVQLDLFYDYRTNLPFYPKFQQYFRDSQVPVLTIWGKNDDIFVFPGSEAFKRDVKKLVDHPIDSGHFAIETNEVEFADAMHSFFQKFDVFKK